MSLRFLVCWVSGYENKISYGYVLEVGRELKQQVTIDDIFVSVKQRREG